jgi:hypothetical protein
LTERRPPLADGVQTRLEAFRRIAEEVMMTTRTIRRLTAATAAVFTLTMAAPAGAQTLDQVLERYYQARGGLETWRAIDTQRATGIISTNGIELAMVMLNKRPNLGRQDLTFEFPGQGPMSILNVFDGRTAWTVNPMLGGTGAQEVAGPDGQAMKDQCLTLSSRLSSRL